MSETITNCMDPKYGPEYPELGVKIVRLRNGKDRRAHGMAVLEAFLSRQRSAFNRANGSTDHMPMCASGTWYQTGKKILDAVRRQNATRVLSPLENPITMLGDPEWKVKCNCIIRHGKCHCDRWRQREQAVYAAMMEEKRARVQAVAKPKRAKLRRVK